MNIQKKEPQTVEKSILSFIRKRGRGCVFVPADLFDLGSRESIDVALHNLTHEGSIRRLARGVYDYPAEHPVLGKLMPTADTIAKALAGRDQVKIQPAGAYAANALGLSEQVPAKAVFLTDGPSRTVKIGSMTIQLRQTTARNMATAGSLSGMLIQAFRELGQDHITPERIAHLTKTLPLDKRKQITKDLKFAPEWMRPIFLVLAEEKS